MYLNFKIIIHYLIFVVLITLFGFNCANSQKLSIEVKSFDQLMRDTLATQDAVFEAEKKILSQNDEPNESVARGALSTYFLGPISIPALGLIEIGSEEYKQSLIAELKRNCY